MTKRPEPPVLTLDRIASPVGEVLVVVDAEGAVRALDFHDYEDRLRRLLRLHYGAVVLNDKETRDAVAFLQNAAGAVPSPFDSWLDIRGLKTLDLRVKQHSRNAMKVAQWLETRPEVERVWYPGLESHPGHDIAARQMHGGFGGMISIQIAAGFEAAKKFAGATEVFTLAESLGGVESLIEHPGAMTHASVAGTTLEVPANLIRLSVGLEDADDLIADLEQAFRQI